MKVEDFLKKWRKENNTEEAVYSSYHIDAMEAYHKQEVEAMKLNQLPKCKCFFKNKGYHDNGCNYAIKYNKLLKEYI